jgi:hypothetical protein
VKNTVVKLIQLQEGRTIALQRKEAAARPIVDTERGYDMAYVGAAACGYVGGAFNLDRE